MMAKASTMRPNPGQACLSNLRSACWTALPSYGNSSTNSNRISLRNIHQLRSMLFAWLDSRGAPACDHKGHGAHSADPDSALAAQHQAVHLCKLTTCGTDLWHEPVLLQLRTADMHHRYVAKLCSSNAWHCIPKQISTTQAISNNICITCLACPQSCSCLRLTKAMVRIALLLLGRWLRATRVTPVLS
jgi:hypothetical protein